MKEKLKKEKERKIKQKSHITLHTSHNSGITLVALIITIIVLLILAVVAIRAVQGDGIITKAKEAKSATTVAQEKEQIQLAINEWNIQKNNPTNTEPNFESFMREKFSEITANTDGSLTIKMPDTNNEYKVKEDGTITELANNGGESDPNPTEDSLVQMYINGTLKVGDYVDYKPTTASAYSPDGVTVGSLTGYTEGELQSIAQENLNWRVLGYDEANDKLLLISSAPTTNGITIYGHTGYNNYEEVLNNTCSALYSNSAIRATARSITLDDIDKYLGGSAFEKTEFKDDMLGEYGYSKSVSSNFSVDSETRRLTKLDTPVEVNLTHNYYQYNASNKITDAIKLEILQGKAKEYVFGVASRSIIVTDTIGCAWILNKVNQGVVGEFGVFCSENGDEEDTSISGMRPIVYLDSSVTTNEVPIIGASLTES